MHSQSNEFDYTQLYAYREFASETNQINLMFTSASSCMLIDDCNDTYVFRMWR